MPTEATTGYEDLSLSPLGSFTLSIFGNGSIDTHAIALFLFLFIKLFCLQLDNLLDRGV
jgi:hypothetical protein